MTRMDKKAEKSSYRMSKLATQVFSFAIGFTAGVLFAMTMEAMVVC